MSDPNAYQVGGDHYRAAYESWDFILDVFAGDFFLGSANKYITRWRRKGGVEDLRKAVHYLEKAKAVYAAGRRKPPTPMSQPARDALVAHYALSNDLDETEREILGLLAGGQLLVALAELRRLITTVVQAEHAHPIPDVSRR